MAAVEVGIVTVDRQLRVSRIAGRAAQFLAIVDGDEDRPLADLSRSFIDVDLASDAQKVLDGLTSTDREVRSRAGGLYLIRLKPLQTADSAIRGIVIVLVEIIGRAEPDPERSTVETASSLAHEMSQPLAAASNYVAAARHLLGSQPTQNATEALEKAASQLQRLAHLVARLRDFATPSSDVRP
jgi:signal transduction histidine kinase